MATWGLLASAQSVNIGAEDDWAPYSAKVGDDAKGLAVDLVREAFAAAGVQASFTAVPFARCMSLAKTGALLGCFNAARASDTVDDYLWHTRPLFTAKASIYALTDSKESNLTVKSLEGRAVGVTNGYHYGEPFDSNKRITRDVANQDELGFKKLLAGRYPYMIAFDLPANAVFAKNPELAGKFKPVGVVATPEFFVAFTRAHPDGARLLAKFNEGLEAIVKSGRYKAIEDRLK